MRLTSILVLILATTRTKCIYECCPEDNVLSLVTKSCSTNDSISLECKESRIPIFNVSKFKEYNYLLLDNGTLTDQSTNSEIRYCQSYLDEDTKNVSSHIYIFCHEQTEDQFLENKIKIGAILGCISAAFTILTIVVYGMVPKLLDLQGICLIHTLTGLAAGYIFLGVIQLSPYLGPTVCDAMAFLTYFFFLYLFFWLNTLSFHIWRTTVCPQCFYSTTKWAVIYHIYAIGGPLVFLMFLSLAQYSTSSIWDSIRPGIGEASCFFLSLRETMIFFYGPIVCLLHLNVIFYLWTIFVLWRQVETNQHKVLKYRLKLCVRLFIIMGLTWIFEIITAVLKDPRMSVFAKVLFFLLDLFNLLQGLLIFLVLVVFRKKVRRALANKNLCNIQFPNSWKYLEDEELESYEDRTNCTIAEYKDNNVEIKR